MHDSEFVERDADLFSRPICAHHAVLFKRAALLVMPTRIGFSVPGHTSFDRAASDYRDIPLTMSAVCAFETRAR
jgi:hypothetical protein